MKVLTGSQLLPATACVIIVAMALRLATLATNVPALADLKAEAAGAVLAASGTGGSLLPQAQAARLPAAYTGPGPVLRVATSTEAPADAPPRAAETLAAVPPSHVDDAHSTAKPAPASDPDAKPFVAPTDADKALLEDLRNRRSTIETREQNLAQREATAAAAEKRLSERVNELAGLQGRLQGLEKDLKSHDEANWQGMVKLYEAMRPRDAAAIFNALDKPVLIEVLDRMKPAKAAPVLAAMDTEKARQVTADLSTKRTQSTTLAN